MQQADYYIDEDFIKPRNMGKGKVFSHYNDMYGNEFHNMSELLEYIKDEASSESKQVIILFANSKDGDENDNTSMIGGSEGINHDEEDSSSESDNANDKDIIISGNIDSNNNGNDTDSIYDNGNRDNKDKTTDNQDDANKKIIPIRLMVMRKVRLIKT